ncbi:LmeA family phospholipid-binding protein [Mycobacterium sp. SMC-18]|uniref:LmeA family phospholipid-binding protein n=1 Tax=Mycobacteriaceae TaxID=1762 RepID=UPI001FD2BBCC|nr:MULTISPECIES: LmeA family phospholipid-binding protein [unclassified Mycolicibacterium]
MTRPPRRWDPLRPLDLFTSVVSTAAVLPVSTGAAAAYRTALLTVRPLVVGRRITVRMSTSDLAFTVTKFDSRWDAGIFAVGHIGTVNIAADKVKWAGTELNSVSAKLNNLHIRPSVPPMLAATPVEVTLEVPSDSLDELIRAAEPRVRTEIGDDGVTRIRLSRFRSGVIEVDPHLHGKTLWLKPRGLTLGAARVPVPGLAPAYPVRLPELPYGMTLTSVEVGPGVVRVGATLPEWRFDLPRAVLDELINQLSVVGRPLDVIWPG